MLRFRSSDTPATDKTAGRAFSQAVVDAMGFDGMLVNAAPNGGSVAQPRIFSSGTAIYRIASYSARRLFVRNSAALRIIGRQPFLSVLRVAERVQAVPPQVKCGTMCDHPNHR